MILSAFGPLEVLASQRTRFRYLGFCVNLMLALRVHEIRGSLKRSPSRQWPRGVNTLARHGVERIDRLAAVRSVHKRYARYVKVSIVGGLMLRLKLPCPLCKPYGRSSEVLGDAFQSTSSKGAAPLADQIQRWF